VPPISEEDHMPQTIRRQEPGAHPAPITLPAILLLLALSSPAFAQPFSWTVVNVDSTSLTGAYVSLALGSDGYPRVAALAFGSDLEYLTDSAGGWSTQYPLFADPNYISLALDANDDPGISLFANSDGTLRYGERHAGVWSFKTVDTDPGATGFFSSLALDAAGNPRIGYHNEGSSYSLRYAERNGGLWSTQNADVAGQTGYQCQLALNSNGFPGISYYSYTAGCVKYASRNNLGVWTTEVVDATTGPPITNGFPDHLTSIAFDSQGNPRIAYYDNVHGKLRYASKSGGMWTKVTVDSAGNVGGYVSLRLDGSDEPYISYYDIDQRDLKFSRHAQGAWSIERVDSVGDVGRWTSLCLDASGDPYIAYGDGTNGALKLAYGTMMTASVVGDPHRLAAAGLVCGPNPTRGVLHVRFARSLDRLAVLEVVDLAGRRQTSIDVGAMAPGARSLDISTSALRAGMYFVHLKQGPTDSVARIAALR